ncbi:MAG: GtrA family protein [Anaerolineae bacterium]|nr:GtrA family protein [Anaerolineae bacterium]
MTAILSRVNKTEIVRFLKFAVVGVIGAVVDFAVLALLKRFVEPPEVLETWWSSIAVGISLSTAIVSNFIWNRYWTYPDSRSKPIVKQFAQFYVINILAYIIRAPTMLLETVFAGWVEPWFAYDLEAAGLLGMLVLKALGTEPAKTLGTYLAWALGVGIAMFWNFFINRVVTYSDVDQAEQSADADRD